MADLAPTTSANRNTLSAVLKGRKGRKDNSDDASTNSHVSNDTNSEQSGAGMRSSIEGALDKLKRRGSDGRRNSTDSSRKLSAIIGGKKRSKKKRKEKESDAPDAVQNDINASSRAGNSVNDASLDSGDVSASEGSLGLSKSVASSLLTEDSEPEAPPVRPSLSPHQSHAGYLTLSSPLIAAETIDPATHPVTSVADTQPDSSLALNTSDGLEAAPPQNSTSFPVGKLKEAFAPSRRSPIAKVSGDNDSVRSAGSGGGLLGGLLAGVGKRAGSRRGSKAFEDTSLMQEPAEETSAPLERTATPSRIQTAIPATPPNTAAAPTTLITPPTPTDPRPASPTTPVSIYKQSSDATSQRSSSPKPNTVASPSSTGIISHRRTRSANAPSKLSNAISAPYTPIVEETKTPGGSLTTPQSSGGFFSSVFSAAQNAANQLTNTIANTSIAPGQRSRSGTGNSETEKTGQAGGEEVIPGPEAEPVKESSGGEKRQLAVETLGSGDLSLSHLGISDSDPSPMTSRVDLSEGAAQTTSTIQNDEASAKAEDNAAARAVSAAYLEKPNGEISAATSGHTDRPRSVTTLSGDRSPPPFQPAESESGTIRRAGSVRSRISAGRKRRHRGSSATTGNTIAAAVGASTAALANPAASGQRLTGFTVANPKRNKDFHQQFRSVPEDEYLIEDYSAALQREILLQGRLYISEGHVCFSSNILGWVTNLVISFDEIVSVEKKSTAVIFPNAIVIQTLHARNVFASLVSRDTTYDLIINIWKTNHPNLKSSLNGVTLDDAGTGDKTEKASTLDTDDDSEEGSDTQDNDDAVEEEVDGSFVEAGEGSIADSDIADVIANPASRKVSAIAVGAPVSGGSAKVVDNAEAIVAGAVASQDFPGPATHAPTDCGDEASHYDKLLVDTTIPAPLGKIYSLMFGPSSGVFMTRWLIDDQKSTELQMEDDKKGLGPDKKTFSYSFIKPLNASIGPKQTKCLVSQTLEQYDLEKAVTVNCSTQNPDVPSGNIFTVKTRYCLMWAANNSTRLVANCAVEWTGKSWLKGPIEKGCNDGQQQYAKDLVAALRAAVTTKVSTKPAAARGKGKGRRKKDAADASTTAGTSTDKTAADAAAKQQDRSWGIFEPLHGPLGPLVDTVSSVMTPQVTIAVLSLLVVFLWLRGLRSSSYSPYDARSLGLPGLATPARIAAYEELWRREESALWDWLEERVGMERDPLLGYLGAGGPVGEEVGKRRRRKEGRVREVERRIEGEGVGMGEKEIEEAIRVTRERLEALEEAVAKRKRRREEGEGVGEVG